MEGGENMVWVKCSLRISLLFSQGEEGSLAQQGSLKEFYLLADVLKNSSRESKA